MHTQTFPGVLLRIKALVVDWLVILLLMIGVTFLFNQFENIENQYRITAFIFIFCLYDPIFTSFLGGTIGHKLNGICVKQSKDFQKNTPLLLAIVRYLVKSTLGWISLLSISANSEKRAIHDFAARTVVLYEQTKN